MAAASQQWSHQTWTSSTCTPETARGTQVLRIVGYSLHRGLGVDRSIRSTTFAVDGYQYHWSIHYYPDGISSSLAPPGRLVLFLKLVSKKAEVRARFTFRLVDQATGKSTLFHRPWATPTASSRERSDDAWGAFCVKKKSELEAYLRDDCLVIECDVTVIKEPQVNMMVRVPPSDLSGSLAKLLQGKKGADVTFRVGDELFPAHKIVLAMRSPVFDAQFYGPMREEDDDDAASQCSIAIEDMQPAVFRALLHFIYTDSMPSMEGFDAVDRKEMVKHLLVAADRYAVERLKLMCEGILCKSLDAKDAETTLALLHKRFVGRAQDHL
ncbi:BTB/POZ and MATH domain-containing protein 2-like [Miscanthus floridulus]|uniref:BTB/POZ and MATH domain-containing protein 2-like n=1 Tax=Miscanthus floridulus TaxID=154761 RepID=UPI003457CA7F